MCGCQKTTTTLSILFEVGGVSFYLKLCMSGCLWSSGDFSFSASHVAMGALGLHELIPVSTSHLAIGALGLHIHTAVSTSLLALGALGLHGYVGSGSGIWKSEFTSSYFCIASTSLTEPSLWLFLIRNSDVIMFELMLKHTYVIAVLIEYGPEATLCLGEFNEAVC